MAVCTCSFGALSYCFLSVPFLQASCQQFMWLGSSTECLVCGALVCGARTCVFGVWPTGVCYLSTCGRTTGGADIICTVWMCRVFVGCCMLLRLVTLGSRSSACWHLAVRSCLGSARVLQVRALSVDVSRALCMRVYAGACLSRLCAGLGWPSTLAHGLCIKHAGLIYL